MRVAVTGSQGQVVQSLIERAQERGIELVTLGRPAFDLARPSTIFARVRAVAPDVIVNAAAYTAVDKAETHEPLATCVNGAGAGTVAQAAARAGIPVLQLSTDYVFDGRVDRPYREVDAAVPLNAYGRSKLAGERLVSAANPRHVILRTSWVYSPFGTNFLRTMLRLGEARDAIPVIDDQVGCPTSAHDIADAVLDICAALQARPRRDDLFGIFHFAGAGAATWADFAEAIFTEAARRGRRPVRVERITSAQYPAAARRPVNSRLDTRKLTDIYGVVPRPWRAPLPSIIERALTNR